MKETDLKQAILDLVNRPGYQPLKPRMIAKKLGMTGDRGADVKKAVKKLVSDRQLAYGDRHLVQPPGVVRPKGNRMVGVFQRREGGFGFVRPSGAVPGDAEVADVYIPARRTKDAATGDGGGRAANRARTQNTRGPTGRDRRNHRTGYPSLRGKLTSSATDYAMVSG